MLHAGVAERQADGTLAVSEATRESWQLAPAIGGVIGGLLGVVGGPVGIALGAGAGALVGEGAESKGRHHALEMLHVVHQHPEPGAVLLLAELSEPSRSPVDAELLRLGGWITRKSVFDVERELAEAEGR